MPKKLKNTKHLMRKSDSKVVKFEAGTEYETVIDFSSWEELFVIDGELYGTFTHH